MSRVLGCTFTRSIIQEALLRANLDENVAINLLLDNQVEVATSTQVDSLKEVGMKSSLDFEYSQNLNSYPENSNREFLVSDSDSSDDEVVIVDAWPKRLGELTINGFLTINCNTTLSIGSFVSFGAKLPVLGSFSTEIWKLDASWARFLVIWLLYLLQGLFVVSWKGWITQLRPYQEFAVKWMMNRESSDSQQAFSDPMWEQVETGEGFSFFMNRTLSRVSLTKPTSDSIVRGGILADEMGLGKTVESLALIAESSPIDEERRRQGINGTLIVVPLSLLNQWLEELYTHMEENTFEILTFYGSTKSQFQCNIVKYDIVLTTYGTLCAEFREKKRFTSPLYTCEWYRVILDEAHIIKDRNTQTAKACFALNSERRWLLTGTPIQNSLDDFFSFVHFLKVYPYAEYKFWVRHILKPHSYKPNSLERKRAEYAIHSLIHSFLLRRTKRTPGEDGMPIVSLPERRVEIMRLEPFEEERNIYLSLYAHSKSTFEMLVSENRLLANFATVLELVLRLRQCCDHPDLVLNSSTVRLVDLSSADKFADTIQRIFFHSDNANSSQSSEYLSTVVERLKETFSKGDNLECPICLDMVDDGVMFCSCGHVTCKECVLAMLQRRNTIPCPLCRVPVTKNVIIPLPMKNSSSTDVHQDLCAWQRSSKLVALVKELKAIERCRIGLGYYEGLTTVGKTVVFSQWTRCLDIVEAALRDNGLLYMRLDGKLSSQERSKVLASFRSEPSDAIKCANILLVSLKAGGVGLNLTAASQVFLIDPWWNPAVEEQAIDRVHRIGQTRTVIVKRLIIAQTIEENLLLVQERKKLIADSMLGSTGSTKDRKQITVEDLTLLFKN
ncbi:Putative SWI/SNF-related matrix-associated actin-dependent regulator of chromatin subfamily A member 3-like 3 [Galdieria sulphuraria]|nr:Putative SWI/SNF-related matrix-associated actin-dependent regulator of chromatin subfamily A member 3-like 3 [Galdieria sulphuraria]